MPLSVCAAAATLVLGPIGVPTQSPITEVITEADFLSAVGDDHPALVIERASVAAAQTAVGRARRLGNPELAIVRESPTDSSDQLDLTLDWRLPQPARGPSVEAQKHRLSSAEARYEAARLALRFDLRSSFAAWAVATARAEGLSRRVATIAELTARERRRADAGETSGLHVGRLDLAAAEFAAEIAIAESDVARALALAEGLSGSRLVDGQPLVPALPPAPEGIDGAHPSLEALDEDLAAAEDDRRAEGRYLQAPGIVVGWQEIDLPGESLDGPILGLRWSVPISDRGQPERELAGARHDAADARFRLRSRTTAAGRRGALASFSRLRLAALEAAAANAGNDDLLVAATAAFEAGEVDLTSLLDTVRSVLASETAQLRLRASALEAHHRLERLAGRALPLQ